MSYTCSVASCSVVIGDDKLMCASHWSMVPVYLQRDVNRYWRERRKTTVSSRDRLVAINNHRVASDAAIKHVDDALRPLIAG